MSFKLFIHQNPVEIKISRFPAGETHIAFDTKGVEYPLNKPLNAKITFLFQDNGEIFDLALLVDALRRNFTQSLDIVLDMPYLPYGRQDRACNEGEAFSLKVLGNLINSLDFRHVLVDDAHSDVAGAVIDRLQVVPQHICARGIDLFSRPENTILVSPDSGALKKTYKFAKHFGYKEVVRADKIRDIESGKITDTVVFSEAVEKDFLIVDDIGDGMGTFVPLAKRLRELTTGQVDLYVTHAIFSKGVGVIDSLFENVYYHNNLSNYYSSETMNASTSYTHFTQL